MGVVGQSNGKMKTICILLALGATFITAHEHDFEVVVKNESPLARSFCCLTTNAQSTCATNCNNKDCSATCTVRCGIFMSVCGTYTCSSVASASCTTTTTTTTTVATTTVAATTTTTSAAQCCQANGSNCCPSGQSCTPTGCV